MYETIDITIAPEKKLSLKDVRKAANDYGLFAPTTKWDDSPAIAEEQEDQPFLDRQPVNQIDSNNRKQLETKIRETLAPTEDDMAFTTPFLDTHTLRAISRLQHPELWPDNPDIQAKYEEADITTELVERLINAIQSKDTTPEEQALGFFTRKKLKLLSTWELWHKGETKQLNQFKDLLKYKESDWRQIPFFIHEITEKRYTKHG